MYIVTSQNNWDEKKKPCEDAVKKDCVYTDTRFLKIAEEFNEKRGHEEGSWLSKGFNHGFNENGWITRQFNKPYWCVEIDSLEKLQFYLDAYGSITIVKQDYLSNYLLILG
jgi:hypothetical protein